MIAAILAKRSERFPGKHMYRIGDRTMIGTVVERLMSVQEIGRIIIFTKDPEVKDRDAEVLEDTTEGTAMDSIRHLISVFGEVFVFAGDMPFVNPVLVRQMILSYNGVPIFPVQDNGTVETLHAIYNSSMLDAMDSCLSAGKRSLRCAVDGATVQRLPVDEKFRESFSNINYPSDIGNGM